MQELQLTTGSPAWREEADPSGRVIVIDFKLPPDPVTHPVPVDRPPKLAGRRPRTYKRPDDLILDDLVGALAASYDIDATEVDLTCADGVITASGRVATRAEARLLEALAVSTVGLTDYISTVEVSKGVSPPEPAEPTEAAEATSTSARKAKTPSGKRGR